MGNTCPMARSIWTGAISFGLVTVPVKLYSSVNRKTVRFHQLNGKTGVRIAQKRVDPSTGDEVAYDDIVKGFELTPDHYVVIEPGELETLQPKKTKTIEIEDFVELSEIDPIFYDHPYYLAPGTGGAKPYRLLVDAMRESGRVAIARVVIRSKEQLVALRPMGDHILGMSTMLFPDEVVEPDSIGRGGRPGPAAARSDRPRWPRRGRSRARPRAAGRRAGGRRPRRRRRRARGTAPRGRRPAAVRARSCRRSRWLRSTGSDVRLRARNRCSSVWRFGPSQRASCGRRLPWAACTDSQRMRWTGGRAHRARVPGRVRGS